MKFVCLAAMLMMLSYQGAWAGNSVQRDIAYGADARQRMDVYIPPNAHAAPVILMVHGGAWQVGDKTAAGVIENKVARWLPKGIIFISVNYRLSPQADPLIQAKDVALALAKAQALAPSWGGDPARFVLMGHSAGAHLVALLASAPALAKQQGAQPWLGTISLDSGALDLMETMTSKHLPLFDKVFGADPSYWREVSPLQRLTDRPAPLLVVCSALRNDSCPQARSFVAKAAALGAHAVALPVALTHMEINRDLGISSPYTDNVEAFMRALGLPL
ncbi:MAG: alpha/beta hydrolase [Betaproteobacteria bacterium]|nr:alpha/beta hydrolase [Betaproteobacteria bacterium]